MSFYQTSVSEIERDILIKMEADETNEIRIKSEVEHLRLITETGEFAVDVHRINVTHNTMLRLFNEINNSAGHRERLRTAHHFINASNLLLRLVTAYEMKFHINPDSTIQDVSQIGSLIWYRGVLGIIRGLETILMEEVQNEAADVGTAAHRFQKIVQTLLKWQEKAQCRYPHAR